jgi:hypothetical protein
VQRLDRAAVQRHLTLLLLLAGTHVHHGDDAWQAASSTGRSRSNLAVGGDWPGSPNASTPFPARMLVDWVTVYA